MSEKPRKIGNIRNKKGQFTVGNTEGGRTVGSGLNLTSLLKTKLENVEKESKKAYSALFIEKLLDKALVDNDIQALKLIINYIDGMPRQAIELDVKSEINNISDDELNEMLEEGTEVEVRFKKYKKLKPKKT